MARPQVVEINDLTCEGSLLIGVISTIDSRAKHSLSFASSIQAFNNQQIENLIKRVGDLFNAMNSWGLWFESRGETAVRVANSSVDAADAYFASIASWDKTLPRYNVNTFLNSATTRTFPLESASP